MDVAEILAELEYIQDEFPRKALENALANREAVVPELLVVLERAVIQARSIATQPDYILHMYAMFLLAQFREPRAYPLVVELVSAPPEVVDQVLGDIVTEDLCRILASVSCGDDSLLRELIENENANEYVRDAALRALGILVACGEKPREEVIDYFRELFNGRLVRSQSQVWNSLVSCSTDLYPEELYPDILRCYEDDLIDTFFVTLDEVKDTLAQGKDQTLSELKRGRLYSLGVDTVRDMQRWAHFQSEEESRRETRRLKQKISKLLKSSSGPGPVKTAETKPPKLGRNSPCPCGSGKKYKKCCLNKEEANRLAENRSSRVDDIDVLDELSNSVPDLVRAGRLDEAEAVCQQLLTRYPDHVDGLDRLAIVYEAKGERARAAEYYRKAADFMRTHAGYDEQLITMAVRESERLIAEDEAGLEPSGPRCRN